MIYMTAVVDMIVAILAQPIFPCGCGVLLWLVSQCVSHRTSDTYRPMEDQSNQGECGEGPPHWPVVLYTGGRTTPSVVPSPTSALDATHDDPDDLFGEMVGDGFSSPPPGHGNTSMGFFMTTCQIDGCDARFMRQPSKLLVPDLISYVYCWWWLWCHCSTLTRYWDG